MFELLFIIERLSDNSEHFKREMVLYAWICSHKRSNLSLIIIAINCIFDKSSGVICKLEVLEDNCDILYKYIINLMTSINTKKTMSSFKNASDEECV